MNNFISIIKDGLKFTPLYFYNTFLKELADYYRNNKGETIEFVLFEKGDKDIYNAIYSIDPISIPLLLSIIEQLSKFHKSPLKLHLHNNHATSSVLEFLFKINFFKIIGPIQSPNFISSNILEYDEEYLGWFKGKDPRKDHMIRLYDKKQFTEIDFETTPDIELRDQVNSLTSYKVIEHFSNLLQDSQVNQNKYITILAELITNGVIHSKSTTYAMMFSDKYQTKFSISDNGIGLFKSLQNKQENLPYYYNGEELKDTINKDEHKFNSIYLDNLLNIFEVLYYSSLKERRGLFDLMINVVINGNGYFRLHTEYCQIIISNRNFKFLDSINDIREQIFDFHQIFELENEAEDKRQLVIDKLKDSMKYEFIQFITNTLNYYSNETRYSSIRFFPVKFKGVHIEVEIPK